MSSPQAIDTQKRLHHLGMFLRAKQHETSRAHLREAVTKEDEFISLIRKGNANPGLVLSHKEIERRLRKLNPNLLFMQSLAYPDQGGIYLSRPDWNPLDDPFYKSLRLITGMGWGMVPERTTGTITPDENGDLRGNITKKGWRTTLCTLIQARAITLPAAERAFPGASEGWHRIFH